MTIAAAPKYLGNKFKQASPGMRFGMYLSVWELEQNVSSPPKWTIQKNKSDALKQATCLNTTDKETAKAILARQQNSFGLTPSQAGVSLSASSIAPFTTGLGYEHPLENGFSFLNPYGLPYLSGSSVKGVLRQAVRELASGDWGALEWNDDKRHIVPNTKPELEVSDIDVLFGLESEDHATEHLRGVLSFWDVLPQVKSDQLMVEVMTPHQSHYYQGKKDNGDNKNTAGSESPHDSGSPKPIYFLTVPPESEFLFYITCNAERLETIAPDLAHDGRWKFLILKAFEHAFDWLGFGAKTSVGYGAMRRDVEADKKREAEDAEKKSAQNEQARLAQMTFQQQAVEEFVKACVKRKEQLNGNKDKPNTELHQKAQKLVKTALEDTSWTRDEKCLAADVIEQWLPEVLSVDMKEQRKKLKLSLLREAN